MEINKKDLWKVREENSQIIFNLHNWVRILERTIPNDFKSKNVDKECIISGLKATEYKLRRSNNKLMELLGENI